jgi:hypothetical protein
MTLALLKGGPELHTDPRWYSYLLGWISHGLLDRAWHPYIIYRSGWHQPSLPETRVWRFYHPFLERLCDVLLFQEKTGRNLWEEPFQPRMPALCPSGRPFDVCLCRSTGGGLQQG